MQFDFIKEILTGSITGYITNAIAIKMIFKEYGIGKLKLGGIVVKTRDEFIDNVSSLVDRDIINADTLRGELVTEDFNKSIRGFVNYLLNTSIHKNTFNLSLGEMEGFYSTINKTQNHLKDSVEEEFPEIFHNICKNIYLKDLLSEKQAKHISRELYDSILDTLSKNDFIEKTAVDFYNENKSLSFSEFFSDKLINVLSENFVESTKDFHIYLKSNFDIYIDTVFENTLENLEINKILTSLEEKLVQKKIIDFINSEDSINLCRSLAHKIKDFLLSHEGRVLINSLTKELLNILKSINRSVLELFSEGLRDNIENFFKDKLQYAVKEIILWIENNKGDIEGLIEKAIEDTIDSTDDSMKKNVLNLVKDKFLNDVANKFDIVSKITEYLKENADIDSISKDITVIIITYLKEEKISDIIHILQKNKIFTEESIDKFISHNFINYIDYIPEDYFNNLLNKKIKDICNINLQSIFQLYVKEPLKNTIKNKYIYTENVTRLVREGLVKSLKDINNLKIEELITEEVLYSNSGNIKGLIIEKIKYKENIIIDSLYKELNNSIDSLTLNEGLNDELRENLLDEVMKAIFNNTQKYLKNFKDVKVKKVYEKIKGIENIEDILTNFFVSMLENNLQLILKGNIKKAVSSNLHDLKDEELQVMVEDFMGKEMKPITVIGAMLGGIVGIGMYFFDKSAAQYSLVTGTLISIVVYALVGWLTNVQALEMLFKPYTEKRFFGIKIPFTPGVIVSRKSKFAKSMSNFVDQELLKKNSMEELFSKNKDLIYNKLAKTISEDNYKILGDFLYNHRGTISDKSYEQLKKFICGNKYSISNYIAEELGNFSLSNMDLSNIKGKWSEEILEKTSKNLHEIINNELNKFIKNEKEVLKIIPESFRMSVKKSLNHRIEEEIDKLMLYINKEDNKAQFFSMFSDSYDNLANKAVNQLVGTKNIEKLKEYVNSLIKSKISSQETRIKIFTWFEEMISKEFNPNKRIDQLFGGFFLKMIEDNFSYIIEGTVKSIIKGLSNNQNIIAEVAITTTKENLNFIELMGYNMLGGDQIISSIVDNLIKDKFPAFMETKKEEINQLLGNFVNDKICNSTIENLNISLQYGEVLNLVNNFINNDENICKLNGKIIKISDSIIDCIMKVKAEEYLSILYINKIQDLMDVFKNELSFVEKELKDTVNEKRETLAKVYTKLAYDIIENLVLAKKICVLSEGIDKVDIKKISKKLSELLYESDTTKENISEFIQSLIEEKLKTKNVDEIVNFDELNNCMASILEKLIENEKIGTEIKVIVDNIIKDIIVNNLSILDPAAKKAVTNIVISSIVDSAEINFLNILNSIDFRSITKNEISNMEPKEIEDLFNSFAKKYFNKLKLYGLGGAVFGLHWIIGVICAVLYAGSEMKEKN